MANVAVNEYLQSVEHPELFGGGDCICFEPSPLAKVGVYAVRQSPVLLRNLMGALEGWELRPFHPQTSYLLILNMGDRRGIFWRGKRVWHGRIPFWIKNRLDLAFMRRFQVSGAGSIHETCIARLLHDQG